MSQKTIGQELRHPLLKNGQDSHFSLISLIIEEPKEIGQELRHPLFKSDQGSHYSLILLIIHEPKKHLPGAPPLLVQKWPRESL